MDSTPPRTALTLLRDNIARFRIRRVEPLRIETLANPGKDRVAITMATLFVRASDVASQIHETYSPSGRVLPDFRGKRDMLPPLGRPQAQELQRLGVDNSNSGNR
jgi:hypothetical protein